MGRPSANTRTSLEIVFCLERASTGRDEKPMAKLSVEIAVPGSKYFRVGLVAICGQGNALYAPKVTGTYVWEKQIRTRFGSINSWCNMSTCE